MTSLSFCTTKSYSVLYGFMGDPPSTIQRLHQAADASLPLCGKKVVICSIDDDGIESGIEVERKLTGGEIAWKVISCVIFIIALVALIVKVALKLCVDQKVKVIPLNRDKQAITSDAKDDKTSLVDTSSSRASTGPGESPQPTPPSVTVAVAVAPAEVTPSEVTPSETARTEDPADLVARETLGKWWKHGWNGINTLNETVAPPQPIPSPSLSVTRLPDTSAASSPSLPLAIVETTDPAARETLGKWWKQESGINDWKPTPAPSLSTGVTVDTVVKADQVVQTVLPTTEPQPPAPATSAPVSLSSHPTVATPITTTTDSPKAVSSPTVETPSITFAASSSSSSSSTITSLPVYTPPPLPKIPRAPFVADPAIVRWKAKDRAHLVFPTDVRTHDWWMYRTIENGEPIKPFNKLVRDGVMDDKYEWIRNECILRVRQDYINGGETIDSILAKAGLPCDMSSVPPKNSKAFILSNPDKIYTIGGKNYKIRELCSDDGCYGDVFIAVDQATQQEVAIKVFRQLKDDDRNRETEQYEKLLKKGQHPNIVNFIGSGDILGRRCLVLEYLKDYKSRYWWSRSDQWNSDLETQYQEQYRSSLDFISKAGVRRAGENEGQNVLVKVEAGRVTIKLIDFDTEGMA